MGLIAEPFCRQCACCHKPGDHKNAPRPPKRDGSTNGEPSPGTGPQAEVPQAGTGSGTPAVRGGHNSERGRKERTAKAPAKAPPPTAGKFDREAYHRDYMREYMRKRRAKQKASK